MLTAELSTHPAGECWAPMQQKATQGLSTCISCLLLVTCFSVKSWTGFCMSIFLGQFLTTLLLLLLFNHLSILFTFHPGAFPPTTFLT